MIFMGLSLLKTLLLLWQELSIFNIFNKFCSLKLSTGKFFFHVTRMRLPLDFHVKFSATKGS